LLDGEVMDTNDIWNYEGAYYIRNPNQLLPRNHNTWPNSERRYKERREWLLETLTGSDPEQFMQLLINVCVGEAIYSPSATSMYKIEINYKKAKAKILHLIKCAFDCYEKYDADVEYKFDRKATW
jgi:hypothetical protein